jgi:hypothetical protein
MIAASPKECQGKVPLLNLLILLGLAGFKPELLIVIQRKN